MAAVYTKLYKRLKHGRFPLLDKLKLLKYAWKSDNINIPNKEQDLIDVLATLLGNKKQNPLTDDESEQVWNCLCDVLSTKKAHLPSKYGQTLIIKPILSKALLENIQSYVNKEINSSCLTTVQCCRLILTSPTLSYLLTSKYDSLTILLSALAELTCQQWNKDGSEVLVDCLQVAVDVYSAVERRVLNQGMVKQLVTDKLLKPLVSVWYLLSSEGNCNNDGNRLKKSIMDLMMSAYFHQNHQVALKSFLEAPCVTEKTNDKGVAKATLFSTIHDVLHKQENGSKESANTFLQKSIASFLPEFYKEFLKLESFEAAHQFKMFCLLCEVLGFNKTGNYAASLKSSAALKRLNALLELVQQTDIYNIATDNEKDKEQFKFYTSLLQTLMNMKRCRDWYLCVKYLLQMNHEIIQQNMIDFLCYSWLDEAHKNKSEVDTLMAAIVTTYGKLHQEEKWLNFVFSAIDKYSDPDFLTMPNFYKSFREILGRMHQTLVIQLWSKFNEKCKDLILKLDDDNEDMVCSKLRCVGKLYNMFLVNISVVDYSVASQTQKKVRELMEEMQSNILTVMLKKCIKNRNEKLLYTALVLSVSVGDLKLLSLRYTKPQADKNETETSSLHSYLSSKKWKKVQALITEIDCPVLLHFWDLLTVQKIRSCLILDEIPCEDLQELLTHSLSLPNSEDVNKKPTWDGKIESIDEDNYRICRWQTVTKIYPLIINHLTDEQLSQLAEFIVHTLTSAQTELQDYKMGDEITFHSESVKFLHDPQFEDCRKLHSAIINCILKLVFVDTTEGPKRKKALAALIGSEQKIEWHNSMERETLGCLTCIVTTVLKRLESDSIEHPLPLSELSILVLILKTLPISSFKEAEKLRTIYVSVIAVRFLHNKLLTFKTLKAGTKRKSLSKSEGRSDVERLLCDFMFILSVLFESCNRVAVFQLLTPTIYFDWIIQLYSHCETWGGEIKEKMMILIEMSCFAVLVNVDVLLTLGVYIKQVATSLENSSESDSTRNAKTYVLASLVKELTSQYARDFVRDDVETKCQEYMKTIKSTVKTILLQIQGDNNGSQISREMIILLGHVVDFVCVSNETKETKVSGLVKTVDFVLQVVLNKLEQKPTKEDELIYLEFLTILYSHQSNLASVLNQNTTQRVWQVIVSLSHGSHTKDIDDNIHEQKASKKKVLDYLNGDLDEGHQLVTKDTTTKEIDIARNMPLCESETDLSLCVQSLMALVVASCDKDNFKKIIDQILEDVTVPCYDREKRIESALYLWREILSLTLTPDQGDIIVDAVPKLLIKCGHLLQDVKHINNRRITLSIVLPVLTLEAAMLSYGHRLMKAEVSVMCLNSCQLVNLTLTYDLVLPVFSAIADIINNFFLNHEITAVTVVPTVISITKLLFKLIGQYGSQDLLIEKTEYQDDMCTCAGIITRLCNSYRKQKVEFSKLAIYIIADYCSEVQKVTLLPAVKKALLPGIYYLLDACDVARIKQLQTILPQGVKDVFLMLNEDYVKYHKYTGKS